MVRQVRLDARPAGRIETAIHIIVEVLLGDRGFYQSALVVRAAWPKVLTSVRLARSRPGKVLSFEGLARQPAGVGKAEEDCRNDCGAARGMQLHGDVEEPPAAIC